MRSAKNGKAIAPNGTSIATETMARARVSDEDKRRLLRAFQNEEDYLELADQLDIKRGTANSIVYR